MDFFKKICEISPLSNQTIESLRPHLKELTVPKGELLISRGEVEAHISFIVEGSVRLFYVTHDGKDFNQVFKFEGDLVAGYASLLTKNPCQFSIEALEETKLIQLPFKKITELYESSQGLERLGRKVAEQHFLNKEKREASFLLLNAKSRYQELLIERPNIHQRVSQYHIASYLGITAESFNRLLKDLS